MFLTSHRIVICSRDSWKVTRLQGFYYLPGLRFPVCRLRSKQGLKYKAMLRNSFGFHIPVFFGTNNITYIAQITMTGIIAGNDRWHYYENCEVASGYNFQPFPVGKALHWLQIQLFLSCGVTAGIPHEAGFTGSEANRRCGPVRIITTLKKLALFLNRILATQVLPG